MIIIKGEIKTYYGNISLLRFMTNGSGEKEKIIEVLDEMIGS